MSISAVVLTHNNSDTLKETLDSLKWCDEILIIDDNSTDETVSKAKKSAKVITHALGGNWAAQRNFALTKTKNPWVLFVDSDEIVTKALKTEILEAVYKNNYDGFYLKRQDQFLGRILHHGETGSVQLLRLGKKDAGRWVRAVHEVWQIKGQVGTLSGTLVHKRDVNLGNFIDRFNVYTDLDARELIEEGKVFSPWELLKPGGKFVYFYFFRLGFLDGFPGFALAVMMSFHSLVVRIKTWELKSFR